MNRQEIIDYYRNNPRVSVLIVGAGVNGIGTFRDLALQGVDVLLVDQNDFCSGASAASSHMIHGGIRYLENGEFRLVREAVRERNLLIKNAPHYVKPLPTIIPIFHRFSGLLNAPLKFLGLLDKPSERGAVVIKIGLMLYDAYSGGAGIVPKHDFFSKKETQQRFPDIDPDVIHTAKYYDGLLLAPERLCIDLILDGEEANAKAHALNYFPVIDSTAGTVRIQDQVTGDFLELEPRLVINACGPWIDLTNANLGVNSKFIGGTKGSHLIANNPELRAAIGDNEFFFENADGRIVLISPFEDKVLIGTSEFPIEDPDSAICTDEEIEYFIEMVDIVFPGIPLKREQIVYQFSGVRPLPANDSSSPGQISRDHKIQVVPSTNQNPFPIYNLVGGKWTSFRAFSEEAADKALEELGLSRKLSTKEIEIGGGRDYPGGPGEIEAWVNNFSKRHGISKVRTSALFRRYGTRAAGFINTNSGLDEAQLPNIPGFTKQEIVKIVHVEKVVHLDDLILRRSHLAKSGNLDNAALVELGGIIGSTLLWSRDQIESDIHRTKEILKNLHGLIL